MTDSSALLTAGLAQLGKQLRSNDASNTVDVDDIDPFEDDGTLDVAEALVTGDWSRMRYLAARAAHEQSADWHIESVALLLFTDPVHRELRLRRSDAFADQLVLEQDVRDLSPVPHQWALGVVLPAGPADFIATTLLERATTFDTAFVRGLVAVTTDPSMRLAGTRALLDDLDQLASLGDRWADLDEELSQPDPEDAMGDALLAARPTTSAGCEMQVNLVASRVERTGWRPDAAALTAVYARLLDFAVADSPDMWAQVAPRDRLPVLLRGAARTLVKSDMGLAAALLSLCHLRIEPDRESLARGVFESARVSAWGVLAEIVQVAQWPPPGPTTPKDTDYFHLSIITAIYRMDERNDAETLGRLIALGRACLDSLVGAPGPNSRDFIDATEQLASGPSPDAAGMVELIDNELLVRAIWGTDNTAVFGSRVSARDLMSSGTQKRLTGSAVLRFATDSSMRRRRGPAAMLLLVNVALEAGDLRQARTLLDDASHRYPRHSAILEWHIKVDLAAGNTRRAATRLRELADLWRSGTDEASPSGQVGTVERLARLRSFRDVAYEHAIRMRARAQFAPWYARIETVLGG